MRGVLTVLVVMLVAAVLFVAAVVATHEGGVLARGARRPRRHSACPSVLVQPEDIAEVRFGMALRGYRMTEVDGVLARLAGELAGRDPQIAKLQDVADEPSPSRSPRRARRPTCLPCRRRSSRARPPCVAAEPATPQACP